MHRIHRPECKIIVLMVAEVCVYLVTYRPVCKFYTGFKVSSKAWNRSLLAVLAV